MTANAIDLCLVSDVKALLNLTQITDDALLQSLVTGASEFIRQYASRDLIATTYTNEVYHGNGGTFMMLRNWPIQSVTSVSAYDCSNSLVWSYSGSSFNFDDRSIYLTTGDVFTKGRANIQVTYQAGYATVPYGLQRACVEMVAHRYREKDRVGMASKGLAGETTAFVITDMPKSTKAYLDQIKNVVPV